MFSREWHCDERIDVPDESGDRTWLIWTYEGDEPDAVFVAQAATYEIAAEIVRAHNATVFARDFDHA